MSTPQYIKDEARIEAAAALLIASSSEVNAGAFVSVREFGASGNGVTDDSAAIQRGLNTLAGTGIWLWFPAGTYQIAVPVNVPSNALVWMSPETVILTNLPTVGGTNLTAAFVAALNFNSFNTTLASNNVVGTKTFSMNAAPAIGSMIQVGGTVVNFHVSIYTVMNVAGAGPFTVTVDRSVLDQYFTTDQVKGVASRPSNIRMIGNNALFTGPTYRYIETIGAYRCIIDGFRADTSRGSAVDYMFSYDNANQECMFSNMHIIGNFTATTFGMTLETGENSIIINCSVQNVSNAGIQVLDSIGCEVIACTCTSNGGPGVDITADGNTVGSSSCKVIGGNYNGNGTYGISITGGSSFNEIIGVSANYNASVGVTFDGSGSMQGNRVASSDLRGNAFGFWNQTGSKSASVVGIDVSSNTSRGLQIDDDTTVLGIRAINSVNSNVIVHTAGNGTYVGIDIHSSFAAPPQNQFFQSGGITSISDSLILVGPGCNGFGLAAGTMKVSETVVKPVGAPAGEVGLHQTGGVLRIGSNVDASACATPTSFTGGIQNRFTQVLAGAATTVVAWPDLKSTDNIELQIQARAGTLEAPYQITPNPGVGFMITPLGASPALDTSTLQVLIT